MRKTPTEKSREPWIRVTIDGGDIVFIVIVLGIVAVLTVSMVTGNPVP